MSKPELKNNSTPEEKEEYPFTHNGGMPARKSFLKGKVKLFGHFVHSVFLLLALFETVLLFSAWFAAGYFSPPAAGGIVTEGGSASSIALLNSVVIIVFLAAMGLYHARQRERLGDIILRVFTGVSLCFAVFFLIQSNYPNLLFVNDKQFILFGLFSLGSILITRTLYSVYIDGVFFKRKVLIFGVGQKAGYLKQLRRKADRRGFDIIGYVGAGAVSEINVDPDKILSLGKLGICQFAILMGIDEIVIAVDDRRQSYPSQELLDCRMNGIEVTDIVNFFERETGRIPLKLINVNWFIQSDGFKLSFIRSIFKRFFDVVVSMVLLLLTLPLSLFTTLAIWFENRGKGPVFYSQRRVGQGGETFNIIKFRSMVTDAEQDGKPQWAIKNDSRVTRVGATIRKYRIDEIPQLINVIRGTMSLVGPRPERPEFVTELARTIPFYNERHRIKPGITGWAQSCYPYGASEQDSLKKHEYDLFYVKNHTFLLDLSILLQTGEIVLFGKGGR